MDIFIIRVFWYFFMVAIYDTLALVLLQSGMFLKFLCQMLLLMVLVAL
jgi:hypothetical protein